MKCVLDSVLVKKMRANTDQWLNKCPKDTEQHASCSTCIIYS